MPSLPKALAALGDSLCEQVTRIVTSTCCLLHPLSPAGFEERTAMVEGPTSNRVLSSTALDELGPVDDPPASLGADSASGDLCYRFGGDLEPTP